MTEKLIAIAKSQLGTKEQGGNNKGPEIQMYQMATWLKPGAWPWCAAFVAWCVREWLGNSDVRELFGLQSIDHANKWRCKDASAFGWIKWANEKGFTVIDEKQLAKAGDLVVFDFSHIGIVVADQVKLSDQLITIEGNTAPKTTQRDGLNDGVYMMKRSPKLVRNYLRLCS